MRPQFQQATHIRGWFLNLGASLVLGAWCLVLSTPARAASASPGTPERLFEGGIRAYRSAEYRDSAAAFQAAALLSPAAGTLQNLGNAQWQCGETGAAVAAWEQALWLDPLNKSARSNLRYARKTAQLETPQLAWYEVVSTWLPADAWAWIAGFSLWAAVALTVLPGILRWRRSSVPQALAALGLALFLLTLPALLGVHTRARLGFILQADARLRLTPTAEGQTVAKLSSGDPVRLQRARGRYLFVRTSHGNGWLDRNDLALICPDYSTPPPLSVSDSKL